MMNFFTAPKLALLSSFIFVLSLFSSDALALAKFNTNYQVYYKVEESGNTHVTFVISQKNNLSIVYATEFGISLNETRINNLKVTDEGIKVEPNLVKNQNQSVISFPFNRKVVGKDKVHNFTIEYDTPDIVSKQGNTWQIDIPRFESDENVSEQTAILNLPSLFPPPAYIDPKPDIVNGSTYYFSSKILANKPISAIFGKNQYYKGKLLYYLHNSSNVSLETSITLLPNTTYQSVYYETITPSPLRVEADSDGNLLAFYKLKPSQELNIETKVFVKTDFLPRLNNSTLNNPYTEANKIWNYDHNIFTIPEVKSLTSPKSIYDFITNKLKYDYQKINRNGTIRVPASDSLKNYQTAICTDYTDLFVSLIRKINVPSRELEGLAISENPDLKPISDVQDILHAWPEYYDKNRNLWIQVDPTWGSTTRGLDYFNKLDFNHLVFAIHGQDPLLPLPAGSFKKPGSKDKDLEFESIEEIVFPENEIKVEIVKQTLTDTVFKVKNLNGVYLYGNLKVSESDLTESLSQELKTPPFGETELNLKNKVLTGFATPQTEAIIDINGHNYSLPITNKNLFQKTGFLALTGIFLGILTLLARRLLLRRRK